MPQIAKQLPPSGAKLRLLDIACGSGASIRDLKALRPDIDAVGLDYASGMIRVAQHRNPIAKYLHGDGLQLPFAADQFDAVLIQRTYYFIDHPETLLSEALRVLRPGGRLIMVDPMAGKSPLSAVNRIGYGVRSVIDMAAWHLAARYIGGFTPETIAKKLANAGYARILAEPILDGWGVMSRGEKPYASQASTAARVQHALGDEQGATLITDPHTVKGRYVHLLIQQSPNKPVWKLDPNEVISWGAAAIRGDDGQPILLGFSALPAAVSLMQAAVMAGTIHGINKVGKFSKTTAATWDYPILLNPSLDAIQDRLLPHLIAIDPDTAEAPDE